MWQALLSQMDFCIGLIKITIPSHHYGGPCTGYSVNLISFKQKSLC